MYPGHLSEGKDGVWRLSVKTVVLSEEGHKEVGSEDLEENGESGARKGQRETEGPEELGKDDQKPRGGKVGPGRRGFGAEK